jgi:uncharacterized glyoxalase superfamily protein PhnB
MSEKAKPIPEGFRTITPHLTVKNGEQAIEFYQRAFGAELLRKVYGQDGKTLMHCDLKIGDSIVMLNDEFAEWNVLSPKSIGGTSVTLHAYVQDADAAFQRALNAGATVKMPLMDAFWGDRYGQVEDPFGHTWAIATHIEDLSPEETKKRGDAEMAKHSKP